jgi:hypothetical protein
MYLQTMSDIPVDFGHAGSVSVVTNCLQRIIGMKLPTAALAGALMLAGCVSIGPNYDPALIDQIKPGTPKAQVIAQLGRPTSVTKLGDGRQQLMWVYSRGSMGRANSRAAILMFDADGRYLETVSQSETSIR